MMDTSIAGLAQRLDTKDDNTLEQVWEGIKTALPELIPRLIEAYPLIRHYQGRLRIVYGLMKYAARDDVYALGIRALQDPATLVRYRASMLLAFSQRKEAIPHLQSLLRHKDKKTADDAKAAIDATQHQNKDFFMDRGHTGRIHVTSMEEFLKSFPPLSK